MIPLSYGQQRIWFLSQIEELRPEYAVPIVVHLDGLLDVPALRTALMDLVRRHEVLRTVLPAPDGRPYQKILDPPDARMPIEVRTCAPADVPAGLTAAAPQIFDLAAEIPLRAFVFRAEGRDVLLLVVHHIACDAESLGPLLEDLRTAYEWRLRGAPPVWQDLPVRYTDYVLWQRELLGGKEDPNSLYARQLAYWHRTLTGMPDSLALPYDRPLPAEPGHRCATMPFTIPAPVDDALTRLAHERRATTFMMLQTALAAALVRSGAGTDIPIGAAVAGRTDEALDGLVGFLANNVVMRVDASGAPTYAELLDRVRRTTLGALDHQELPIGAVIESIRPARITERTALYQVILTLQDDIDRSLAFGPAGGWWEVLSPGRSHFDLAVHVSAHRDAKGRPAGMSGVVEYTADRFGPRAAERITAELSSALRTLATEPTRAITGRVA